MVWVSLTRGKTIEPLRLAEEAVQFAHIEDGSLRPALLLDDRLNFFPERLYVFRTDRYHEDAAWLPVHDLLSKQLVKAECERLYARVERAG